MRKPDVRACVWLSVFLYRSVFLRVPLPDGEIDYRYAISAMHNAGYSGYMTIEGAWAGDQWAQDEKSITYARAIWDDLES